MSLHLAIFINALLQLFAIYNLPSELETVFQYHTKQRGNNFITAALLYKMRTHNVRVFSRSISVPSLDSYSVPGRCSSTTTKEDKWISQISAMRMEKNTQQTMIYTPRT